MTGPGAACSASGATAGVGGSSTTTGGAGGASCGAAPRGWERGAAGVGGVVGRVMGHGRDATSLRGIKDAAGVV